MTKSNRTHKFSQNSILITALRTTSHGKHAESTAVENKVDNNEKFANL